jgi:hypothetical protein
MAETSSENKEILSIVRASCALFKFIWDLENRGFYFLDHRGLGIIKQSQPKKLMRLLSTLNEAKKYGLFGQTSECSSNGTKTETSQNFALSP